MNQIKYCKTCEVFLNDKWWIRLKHSYYCRECYLNSQAKQTTIEWCEEQAKIHNERLYALDKNISNVV